MAEGLAKQRLGTRAVVRSVGLNPQPEYDSKSAIQTLKDDFGIDASGHRQTHIRDVEIESFNHVIAMDLAIAKALNKLTHREIIIWRIDDPWGGDPAEYRECALQISQQLRVLLTQISMS
jgi:protein-tyrosine-phosphatase